MFWKVNLKPKHVKRNLSNNKPRSFFFCFFPSSCIYLPFRFLLFLPSSYLLSFFFFFCFSPSSIFFPSSFVLPEPNHKFLPSSFIFVLRPSVICVRNSPSLSFLVYVYEKACILQIMKVNGSLFMKFIFFCLFMMVIGQCCKCEKVFLLSILGCKTLVISNLFCNGSFVALDHLRLD